MKTSLEITPGYYPLGNKDGYLLLNLPQEEMLELKNMVDYVQNNFSTSIPYNNSLAGHINHEYESKLPLAVTNYIKHSVDMYCVNNPGYLRSQNINRLSYDGDCWINFQKKYEYNPIHHHNGAFSFVIWYQIPYYKENEIKYGAGRLEKSNVNGSFLFIYPQENLVGINVLDIDKTKEGYMAIFPSKLQHMVNPFYTSDDYRITISGNIHPKN